MKIHRKNLPRVVIIGGGFGGLSAAKALRKAPVRVTLLDRQNHHLFQPLLYQVATAALSPADIAQPLRHILRDQDNLEVLMAHVDRVDLKAKTVHAGEAVYPYDYLILAAGAKPFYFGHADWEKHAIGLKTLDDALEIRRRMLLAFEVAEKSSNDEERRAALTFVIVGAGPTGVEMAGAIAEIARISLVNDFKHIDSSLANVVLVEGGGRVLSTYHPELSESARRQLHDIGVQVRTGVQVQNIDENAVTLKNGDCIPTKTVIWAAGNIGSPLGATLEVPLDRQGRVIVDETLTLANHKEVMVIGDMAHCGPAECPGLPGVCPVAIQQGVHCAINVRNLLAGAFPEKFEYWDKGSMATIGRHLAVAEAGMIRFAGFPAWLAWLFIHLLFLVGLRNKVWVFANWLWQYTTFGRAARLITGRDPRPTAGALGL